MSRSVVGDPSWRPHRPETLSLSLDRSLFFSLFLSFLLRRSLFSFTGVHCNTSVRQLIHTLSASSRWTPPANLSCQRAHSCPSRQLSGIRSDCANQIDLGFSTFTLAMENVLHCDPGPACLCNSIVPFGCVSKAPAGDIMPCRHEREKYLE